MQVEHVIWWTFIGTVTSIMVIQAVQFYKAVRSTTRIERDYYDD